MKNIYCFSSLLLFVLLVSCVQKKAIYLPGQYYLTAMERIQSKGQTAYYIDPTSGDDALTKMKA